MPSEALSGIVREAVPACRRWEVARWGRLLAGAAVLLFTTLGLLHHPGWLVGTLAVAFHLVMTSFTDKCPLRDLLLHAGAREREDLFLPGGTPRPEARTPGSPLKNLPAAQPCKT